MMDCVLSFRVNDMRGTVQLRVAKGRAGITSDGPALSGVRQLRTLPLWVRQNLGGPPFHRTEQWKL